MSRTLPTGFATKAESPEFLPVFLVELHWPSGTVYVWNGYGTISWNGHTWTGTGHLGTISEIRESSSGKATGCTLTLSGIPSQSIIDALANDSQGQPGYIYLTSMNRAGVFEFDPYQVFDGVIDICPMQEDGQSATISVQLEKELIDRRTHNRRRTHEDQQIEYAGDLYFEYVAGLATKVVNWGAATTAASNPVSYPPTMSYGDYINSR